MYLNAIDIKKNVRQAIPGGWLNPAPVPLRPIFSWETLNNGIGEVGSPLGGTIPGRPWVAAMRVLE